MKAAQAAEILGIDAGSDHPDKGGSTEMMQAVNAAYTALESCKPQASSLT